MGILRIPFIYALNPFSFIIEKPDTEKAKIWAFFKNHEITQKRFLFDIVTKFLMFPNS
jgi:hypothetical protein